MAYAVPPRSITGHLRPLCASWDAAVSEGRCRTEGGCVGISEWTSRRPSLWSCEVSRSVPEVSRKNTDLFNLELINSNKMDKGTEGQLK